MNPVLKLLMMLMIALEISFTTSVRLNLVIFIVSLIYLIFFASFKRIIYLLFVTLIPAIGIYFAQKINGNYQYGILLVTRLYAFVTLGGTYTCKTSIEDLAGSLEQNFRVPSKFAYGVMGAFNLIETIKQEIIDIKLAAKMRNVHLSYVSPTLYFKSILAAMNWSTLLAQGMNSHLFVEGSRRTHFKKITIKTTDYLILIVVLIAIQIILIF
ncbi:hypothetical protein AKUH4B412M_11980 [Apilactobacillus kunkeei]|nr:hypothetical protein AKUH4B412M_11980 [Apilactobacillus kunkeei]